MKLHFYNLMFDKPGKVKIPRRICRCSPLKSAGVHPLTCRLMEAENYMWLLLNHLEALKLENLSATFWPRCDQCSL